MKHYTYKEMLAEARKAGLTSEKIMWASIDSVSDLLCVVRQQAPEMDELYWKFMRQQHGIMYSNHYNEAFALYDVEQLSYKVRNKNGDTERRRGAHWSVDEVEAATRHLTFPHGTNKWDKYVAFNAAYSDFCLHNTEEQIIQDAFTFYFNDDDWGSTTKIWDYFYCKNVLRE